MKTVDANFLSLFLHPDAKAPNDPATNLPIERLKERIVYLGEVWSETNETIIIPTPVLGEFLILANEDGAKYLVKINNSSNFRIEPFDQRSAIELSALHHNAIAKTGNKRGNQKGNWAKVKFDRQIVAIAKVSQSTHIYTDDKELTSFAESVGLKVTHTWELPKPPPSQQGLFEEESENELQEWLKTSEEDDNSENK